MPATHVHRDLEVFPGQVPPSIETDELEEVTGPSLAPPPPAPAWDGTDGDVNKRYLE